MTVRCLGDVSKCDILPGVFPGNSNSPSAALFWEMGHLTSQANWRVNLITDMSNSPY